MRRRSLRRGFTLLELLIVMSVIVILASLTIPAVAKFLDGQALAQSGRVIQSAVGEARQAAITQRRTNYLVLFRKPDIERPGEFRYGVRRYSEQTGYEGPEHLLLRGTAFDEAAGSAGVDPLVAYSCHGEMPLPVFEGLPSATQAGVFTGLPPGPGSPPTPPGTLAVVPAGGLSGALKWLAFQKEGNIQIQLGGASYSDTNPSPGGKNLFDMTIEFDGILEADFDGTCRDLSSLNLREPGPGQTDERCFIDIKVSTGKTNIRALSVKLP